ncbi:MAG: hypothetical protein ABSF99_01095 [Anaerolineales bacterium]|jgi:hypothetical protein
MIIENTIKEVFSRLAASELGKPVNPIEEGWEVALPSGRTVTRSTLQAEARALIELGADAVPCLLPWVMNDNPALRYVAIYALEQITGEKPYLPYFDQADHGENRTRAIEVWRRWYKAREKSAGDTLH